jgi:hypothetical protein
MSLAWDPVPGATGYRLYYGTASGQYTGSFDAGNSTQAALPNLGDCVDYYVAVKAYTFAGESGQFSNEVSGWGRPAITGPSAPVANQGDQFTLNIMGGNFALGASLRLLASALPTDLQGTPLVRLDSATVISCTQMQALVTVEPLGRGMRAMEVGTFDIDFEVVNPDSTYGTTPALLTINFDSARMDINQSNTETEDRVDGQDLAWMAYAFGAVQGEPLYNPDADLDGSGLVDGSDLAFMVPGFGLCWSGTIWTASACP